MTVNMTDSSGLTIQLTVQIRRREKEKKKGNKRLLFHIETLQKFKQFGEPYKFKHISYKKKQQLQFTA